MNSKHVEQIDFVLPWVDSSDPVWQKEYAQYNESHNGEDRANNTRFRDTRTLKYVLRSIEKHCPWYHKIYLITTGHFPKWLDVNHSKIKLVTHEKLFVDKSVLPVFNSNAIEMNLANIEDLSGKFVYLNDDMIIWSPVAIERFFQQGMPVDYFHHAWLPRNNLYKRLFGDNTWVDAINRNIALINKKIPELQLDKEHLFHETYGSGQKISNFLSKRLYKKPFWIDHWHHPQPYLKHTISQVFEAFREEMLEVSSHKFRSSKDLTHYLYRYWHLYHGAFIPYFHNDGKIVRPSSLKHLQSIINNLEHENGLRFVCFNDQANQLSENEFAEMTQKMEAYLESRFPHKASFELA